MSAPEAFFDTNILLYLLSEDAAKAERAEQLVGGGGIVSVQVLNEFTSVASRKLGMTIDEIREILETVRAVCAVEPLTVQTHDLALDFARRYGFHIYDAAIVASASIAGCGRLYSEDLQDGQVIDRRLTLCNPFRVKLA